MYFYSTIKHALCQIFRAIYFFVLLHVYTQFFDYLIVTGKMFATYSNDMNKLEKQSLKDHYFICCCTLASLSIANRHLCKMSFIFYVYIIFCTDDCMLGQGKLFYTTNKVFMF